MSSLLCRRTIFDLYGDGQIPRYEVTVGSREYNEKPKKLISLIKKFSKKAFGRQIAAFDE